MSHELEELTPGVYAFGFTGARQDIWHRLGQSFEGKAMTVDEALALSHLDREIKVFPILPPEGARWAAPEQYLIVLGGIQAGVDQFGNILPDVPPKIVGVHGKGGADAHRNFSVRDRFEIAEAAIHASSGEAVWSTAGSLRDGTQAFACMEAPPVVIDPNGVNDIVRSYLTLGWSYDGSKATELGASHVRVVCANTMAWHDTEKVTVIKVKHTSHTAEQRMRVAGEAWAMAQNRTKALQLKAERMQALANGRQVLGKLREEFLPRPVEAKFASPTGFKRATTVWSDTVDQVEALFVGPTNAGVLGETGWAAYNAFTEYWDWFSKVSKSEGETDLDRRLANQFDGTNDAVKAKAADLVLSFAD